MMAQVLESSLTIGVQNDYSGRPAFERNNKVGVGWREVGFIGGAGMVENKQDVLARGYATLSSLRKNIDTIKENRISMVYVQEFHAVLSRLEGIGMDVAEFRVPDSAMEPGMTVSSWTQGDPSSYRSSSSKKEYVQRSFILTKLDAILGYFEIITSEKPRRIGFTKPEK